MTTDNIGKISNGVNENASGFSKKDLFVSLFIGEATAWLLIVLFRGLVSAELYAKFSNILFYLLPIGFPLVCAFFLYIAYQLGKKIAVLKQIGRFVLVGGFNTVVDWGILTFLIFFFRQYLSTDSKDIIFNVFSVAIIYYTLYKSISFVLSAANSYVWNKFWTFERRTTESVSKEFTQFFIVTVIGFLINVGIASGVFKFIGPLGPLNSDQWAIVAAVFATAASMVWNFIGYKFIVFDRKPAENLPMGQ
ncbi:MAG: hypothetical protein UV36_C0013G0003 [Parcubacteria group bacterium GW2011_GWC2_42_6]|nr:MAG: hypothetical protein UU87_C0002G0026 [Parcubacteria group bacterium GW2011_GWA2_42_11]KKS67085.1 MAG: hypothetical protein UV36_C0013G0003 [Parcubacteria group bacterium GW2011_GWC2_42_6]